MNPLRDYYSLLGVTPDANPSEVRAAYRRESFRWHPDRNPADRETAHARFLELGEAISVLGDPAQRERYDVAWRVRHGEPAAPRPTPKSPRREDPRKREKASPGSFDEILKDVARDREEQQRARPSAPIDPITVQGTKSSRRERFLFWSLVAFVLAGILWAGAIELLLAASASGIPLAARVLQLGPPLIGLLYLGARVREFRRSEI